MSHSNRTHAKYSASGYPRYSRCPGSVRLLSTLPPRPSSVWAEDGTRAHEPLELCLRERLRDCAFLEDIVISSAGVPINHEHVRSVQVALDYVYSILDDAPDAIMFTEFPVIVPQRHVPAEDCGGTADISIFIPSQKLLIVLDFKHGAGEAIEVKDNEQTRMYALGLLAAFELAREKDETEEIIETIQVTIMQPRAFHPWGPIRSELLTPEDLGEFGDRNNEAIRRCEEPDAPLIPGDIQCRWCDAKLVCPARQAMVLGVLGVSNVQEIGAATLPAPGQMHADQLAYIKKAGAFVKKWFDDVDAEALRLAREGVYIPGFKLVNVQARRHFVGDPQEVAEKFCLLFDTSPDQIFPRQLLGIGDAEDLAIRQAKKDAPRGQKQKAGERAKEAMAFLTIKESSGNTTLVTEDDKRPAVNIAATAFAGVNLPQIEGPKI